MIIQIGRRKKLRTLIGILKDKALFIKATVSTKRSVNIAVLRATTSSAASPPSEKRIATVLCFGNGSRPTACACIEALMDRLHNNGKNAVVSLKCLITIHNVISKGSFILKDQLSIYPSCGGRNFLNLSKFRDSSDVETWEMSTWVRWYAEILEQNLMVFRVLGYYLCFQSYNLKNHKEDKVLALLNKDLLAEIDVLVGFVEQISHAPDSLELQRKSLVYEVVRLVSEDYRLIQREIFIRVAELGERMVGFNSGELTRLLSALKTLEDCREKLLLVFGNKKKNDEFWDLISQARIRVVMMKEEREGEKLLCINGRRDESSALTLFGERVVGSGKLFRFASGKGWLSLGLDRVPVTLSTVL